MWSQDCCATRTHEMCRQVNHIILQERSLRSLSSSGVEKLAHAQWAPTAQTILNINTANWCINHKRSNSFDQTNLTKPQIKRNCCLLVYYLTYRSLNWWYSQTFNCWNLDSGPIAQKSHCTVMITVTRSSVNNSLLITSVTSLFKFPAMDIFCMIMNCTHNQYYGIYFHFHTDTLTYWN